MVTFSSVGLVARDPAFLLSTLQTKQQTKGEATVQSKRNCPLLLPPRPSVLMQAFGSRGWTFQKDLFSPGLLDAACQEAQEPKVSALSLSLFSRSRPLISASPAGVCRPPLSQTDVCLPVYCSQPGRLCLSHCETQQQ